MQNYLVDVTRNPTDEHIAKDVRFLPAASFDEMMSALDDLVPDGREPTEQARKSLAIIGKRLRARGATMGAKDFVLQIKSKDWRKFMRDRNRLIHEH